MVTDLHAKDTVNTYKRLAEIWSLKFTKSKARYFVKNQCSVTKLKQDL